MSGFSLETETGLGPGLRRPAVRAAMYSSCLGMVSYAASATITPICLVLVAREFGIGLGQAGGMEIARSVLITAVLLMSPWVSARFGKARSLGFSSFLMALGLVGYALAPSYGAVLLALGLLGTGSGVLEGLINPLVQDAAPQNAGRWLNLVNAFWSLGVLVTMVGGGEWLSRGGDWRLTMLMLAGLSLLTGISFLRARGVDVIEPGAAKGGELWRRAREVLTAPRFGGFALMMLLAGGVEGAFTFWSAALVQVAFGGSARAGGLAAACFAGGMIAGRFAAGAWVKQSRLSHLVLGSALAGAGVSMAMPLLNSPPAVGVGLFFAGLCVACFWPSIQAYAAVRLRGETTEIFILLSMAGIPGFGGISWAMGSLGDALGLRAAFWLVPPLFLLLAGLMLWERRQDLHPTELSSGK